MARQGARKAAPARRGAPGDLNLREAVDKGADQRPVSQPKLKHCFQLNRDAANRRSLGLNSLVPARSGWVLTRDCK